MIDFKLAKHISDFRPQANKEVEQVLMTEESLRLQGMLLQQMVPSEASVASLGDDDHVSVLLGATNGNSITVFENDDRIIESLQQAASAYALRSHTVVKFDLANVLPEGYEAKFDVCLSNPPYSSKNKGFGIKVWLSRSVQLLRSNGLGLLVVPIQDDLRWSLDNMLRIQSYLSELGCAIVRIDKDVHAYYDANDEALMSSNIWYRAVKRPETACMIGNVTDTESLYR